VELDIDSETCIEFVGKHVRRLLRNPAAKEATFSAESEVYAAVKAYQKGDSSFKELSRLLGNRLADIMKDNDDIPSADFLITTFDNSGKTYIAIIKLNYGECYIHRQTAGEDGATENQIVKNTVVLPMSASKVEEACLIPYDPMVLRILEKAHVVDGDSVDYFSKLFLKCQADMSKKEMAETIQEIADEIIAKHYDGSVEVAAKVKNAIIQEAEETGEDDGLVLENVVSRAFGEHEKARVEFVELAKEYGLPHQVMLDKPFVQKEFKIQKFSADNGIEIKCPSELFHDPDQVQLTTNPDGSITFTLRNLRPKE
jgi:nucleoid-associated protein YejK